MIIFCSVLGLDPSLLQRIRFEAEIKLERSEFVRLLSLFATIFFLVIEMDWLVQRVGGHFVTTYNYSNVTGCEGMLK